MKKIISILLAVVLLLGLAVSAMAEGSGSLSVENAVFGENNTITLDVKLTGNPGIIAAGLDIAYDSDRLALKSGNNGDIFSAVYIKSEKITVNPYRMMWVDTAAAADKTGDGVLARLTFTVLKTDGDATVTITPIDGNVFNVDLKDRSILGCTFQLKTGTAAEPSASSAATGSKPAVQPGQQVPVTGFKQLPAAGTAGQTSSKTENTGSKNAEAGSSKTAETGSESSPGPLNVNSLGGTASENSGTAGGDSTAAASLLWLYVLLAVVVVVAVALVVVFVLRKKRKAAKTGSEDSTAE